jgi:hypothetical protein
MQAYNKVILIRKENTLKGASYNRGIRGWIALLVSC